MTQPREILRCCAVRAREPGDPEINSSFTLRSVVTKMLLRGLRSLMNHEPVVRVDTAASTSRNNSTRARISRHALSQ